MRFINNNKDESSPSAVIFFRCLLSLAVLIRIFMVFILPFGETVRFRLEGLNDEPSHYNYIRYLVEQRQFPIQTGTVRDPDAFERDEFEYYQAPLYYVIGAFLHAVSGNTAGLYMCRLFSFLCGITTLFVIWEICGCFFIYHTLFLVSNATHLTRNCRRCNT